MKLQEWVVIPLAHSEVLDIKYKDYINKFTCFTYDSYIFNYTFSL